MIGEFVMANNKYYYRAVVEFGSNSRVLGTKYNNIKDCKEELTQFMNAYLQNTVVFIGIKKYNSETNKEFVCPQRENK
jgi:hypothetical protein